MRKPASFLDDVSLSKDDVEKLDYTAPLCCPDDPLDEVLKYIPTLDNKILEALGIDCSSPPHDGRLLGYSPPIAEEDLSLRVVRSTSAAGNSYYSAASSYSSTSWESESSDRAASSSFQYWHVPTKPRRQAVNVRKRPWSHPFLTLPSTPMAAVAVHGTHDINNTSAGNVVAFSYGNDSKQLKLSLYDGGGNFSKHGQNRSVGKSGSGNRSGGSRRSAGRQRGGQGSVCRHCQATETPQWRAGPDGAGTLCNACGIRYRMGVDKLVPEYRPSTSPFFRNGEHSNRHSKVEKLREKKVKALKVSSFGTVGTSTPMRSDGNVDSSLL